VRSTGIVAAVVAERPSAQVAAAVKSATEAMAKTLGSGEIGLACAAALALGHIQLTRPLPLERGDVPAEISSAPATSAAGAVSLRRMVAVHSKTLKCSDLPVSRDLAAVQPRHESALVS
jgi:hypothetical protein